MGPFPIPIIARIGNTREGKPLVECKCECGKTKYLIASLVSNGRVKSCGCLHVSTANLPNNVKDLAGLKFGKLEVIERTGTTKQGKVTWLCKCDCGNEKVIVGSSLTNGLTLSCGCLRKIKAANSLRKTATKHGLKKDNVKEYNAWKSIKGRCYSKNDKNYKEYGERGITMCDEWKNDFKAFLKHVGKAPEQSPIWSIDRIDNNGNYEPGNVRWATAKMQSSNRRMKNVGNNQHKVKLVNN